MKNILISIFVHHHSKPILSHNFKTITIIGLCCLTVLLQYVTYHAKSDGLFDIRVINYLYFCFHFLKLGTLRIIRVNTSLPLFIIRDNNRSRGRAG